MAVNELPSQQIDLQAHAHIHSKHTGIKYFIAAILLTIVEKLLSQKVTITMEAK